MPRVDVVIPTHNRNERLERTLTALARQTFADFRVFVADDASPVPVAPRTAAGVAQVDVLRIATNRGPAHARNRAVACGQAELIAFVDDDVDPAPGWLAAHVATHDAEPGPLVSIGPLLAPPDWQATPWNWWEAATLAREYRRMEAGVYEPTCRQLFTGNAMVRRADFEAAGGFDESLLRAEDVELGMRLKLGGARFVFLPEAKGWHYAHRTFAGWQRMARQYAVADRLIDGRHPTEGWMAMVDEELARRSAPLRAVRRVVALPGGEPLVTAATAGAARAAFAAGRRDLSVRLLSLLYDATYWKARRRASTAA